MRLLIIYFNEQNRKLRNSRGFESRRRKRRRRVHERGVDVEVSGRKKISSSNSYYFTSKRIRELR
jgi:hypothetical protein